MAVRIRLRRVGKNPKKNPHFRISVFDETRGRDSRSIKELGFYNPVSGEIKLDIEQYQSWLKKGALPTEAVKSIVKRFKSNSKEE